MSKATTKILLPKVDVIFRLLFGDKRNIEILIAFLKSVLDLGDDEYGKITFKDTHLKRETKGDKLGIVDILLTTVSGKIIHIEMQILEHDDFPDRVTYYNAKALVAQLKSGDDYKFKKTISIVISDFDIVKSSPDKYHHKFQLRDTTSNVKFTDIVEINTLELSKLPTQTDNTQKHDWLQFLKAEREEEFDMLALKSPELNQAVVELKRLSQTEKAQRLYEQRQKAISDEKARMRTAKNKGYSEALITIASKMLKRGDSMLDVAEFLELPVVELERLESQF